MAAARVCVLGPLLLALLAFSPTPTQARARKWSSSKPPAQPEAPATADAATEAAAADAGMHATAAAAATTGAVTAAAAATAATVDVIVIGAGLAGLKAAVDLKARGLSVLVLEGRDRIGGRVHSTRLGTAANAYTVEAGAQWFHGYSSDMTSNIMCVQSIVRAAAPNGLGVTPVSTGTTNLVRATNSNAAPLDDTAAWNTYNSFTNWASGQTWRASDSLQTALSAFIAAKAITPAQQAGLSYCVNTEIEQEFGASASWLSMKLYDEGVALGGGDSVMPVGKNLSMVPTFLAASLGPGTLRVSHNVTNIAYSAASGVNVTAVSGGVTYVFPARGVVVAVPLGVLKQRGASFFNPPLSANKQTAIANLGMGLLNKVILELPSTWTGLPFTTPETNRWWWNRMPLTTGDNGRFQEFFNLRKATPATAPVPVVVAFQAGQPAVDAENQLTNAATVTALMAQLRLWYGASLPNPVNSLVTRWWNDPWSWGSYSYQTPRCVGTERQEFAKPEPAGSTKPRVWFAGEHTHVNMPATMQGAFLSGKAAAAAVASGLPASTAVTGRR